VEIHKKCKKNSGEINALSESSEFQMRV